jgi:hypothetical protein
VLFFGIEDVFEDLARDVVLHALAVRDGLLQRRPRGALEVKIALQRLLRA